MQPQALIFCNTNSDNQIINRILSLLLVYSITFFVCKVTCVNLSNNCFILKKSCCVFLFFSLLLLGCSVDFTDLKELDGQYVPVFTKANSRDNGILFNADIGKWMRYVADPFEINSFMNWYKETARNIGIDELPSFAATDYCLTIFPKNTEELENIKSEDDITISYFPFDFQLLPEGETYRSDDVFEQRKYHEIVECHTDDGRLEKEEITLPVLYVSWPIYKSLPDNVEYRIDYYACHPDFSGLTEKEWAVLSHLGDNTTKTISGVSEGTQVFRRGEIKYYDNFLLDTIPQPGLKQRFQYGSSVIFECFTDRDGCFDVTVPIPAAANLYHIFESGKWYITDSLNTNAPICLYAGNVGGLWPSGAPEMEMTPTSDTYAYDINPYAYFFYNSDTLVSHAVQNYSVRITSMQRYDSLALGYTYYTSGYPFIKIFDNNMRRINRTGCTIFHELGHVNMWNNRGSNSAYSPIHQLFKESYASYVGWRAINEYYVHYGKEEPIADVDYGGRRGRQSWGPSSSDVYSPFFIDLIDDFNQYPTTFSETITGFPDSEIYQMISTCDTWDQYQNKLRSYTSHYFLNGQFIMFCAPYITWFANNSITNNQ